MFKLERVEISGFKSFYEKVDLAFPGSVTAVVGPNGNVDIVTGTGPVAESIAVAPILLSGHGERSAGLASGELIATVALRPHAPRAA